VFILFRYLVVNETIHYVSVPSQQMAQVVNFHQELHEGAANTSTVLLGIDGVSEAKSNRFSLNVFAIQFVGCRNVYPLVIQRPIRVTGKEEAARALAEVVDQLKYEVH